MQCSSALCSRKCEGICGDVIQSSARHQQRPPSVLVAHKARVACPWPPLVELTGHRPTDQISFFLPRKPFNRGLVGTLDRRSAAARRTRLFRVVITRTHPGMVKTLLGDRPWQAKTRAVRCYGPFEVCIGVDPSRTGSISSLAGLPI